MPSDIDHNTNRDSILVLPWNRWPNYLICFVAALNLVTGIVAVYVAIGFAKDGITSFGDGVATLMVALFGLLFIWVAWCFRLGLLPVRYIADAARRECGFRWARWWNGRFDLAGVEKLIGRSIPRKGGWRWEIRIPGESPDAPGKWIYGSSGTLDSREAAEQECRQLGTRLASHLSLPLEISPAGPS